MLVPTQGRRRKAATGEARVHPAAHQQSLRNGIPLNGSAHIPASVKLWMGDSRGRWEGNTLVVDVTNHNDQTWFDIVGDFHSDALHVAERFTRVSEDAIDYEAVITDPKVYTRPWKMALRFERMKEPNLEMWEEACYENNWNSLEGMLKRPGR